jgi:phosphoribosylanthranilate isomerase
MQRARKIFDAVGPFTATVAVTHTTSADDLAQILSLKPSAIQVSYPFPVAAARGARVLRMIGRGDSLPDDCAAAVVDESRGGGRHFDNLFARQTVQRSKVPVILAGGLTPANVQDAIRAIRPYAVDVASGIEKAPGIKDPEKMRAFIAAARDV